MHSGFYIQVFTTVLSEYTFNYSGNRDRFPIFPRGLKWHLPYVKFTTAKLSKTS